MARERSDSEIQQAVLQELQWDTRVQATEVGVEVEGGVVTLTGTVDDWAKRLAAQRAAHRVCGVLDVANDIVMKVPGSAGQTDTEVATAVRHALEWNVLVPHERIRSTVSGGWVMLEGEVEYYTQREDAERAIRNLSGVRGIDNRIELLPSAIKAAEIRQAIEAALERNADRRAQRIGLQVQSSTVTLTGAVHSWAERQAIVGAARGTRGVREVKDQLRIEPFTG